MECNYEMYEEIKGQSDKKILNLNWKNYKTYVINNELRQCIFVNSINDALLIEQRIKRTTFERFEHFIRLVINNFQVMCMNSLRS